MEEFPIKTEGTIIVHNKRTGEIRIYIDRGDWSRLRPHAGRRVHIIILPKELSGIVKLVLPNGKEVQIELR